MRDEIFVEVGGQRVRLNDLAGVRWVDSDWQTPTAYRHAPLREPHQQPYWIATTKEANGSTVYLRCACGHTESGEDHDAAFRAAIEHGVTCPHARTEAPHVDEDDFE